MSSVCTDGQCSNPFNESTELTSYRPRLFCDMFSISSFLQLRRPLISPMKLCDKFKFERDTSDSRPSIRVIAFSDKMRVFSFRQVSSPSMLRVPLH